MVEAEFAFADGYRFLETMVPIVFEEFQCIREKFSCIIRARAVASSLHLKSWSHIRMRNGVSHSSTYRFEQLVQCWQIIVTFH